MPPRSQAYRRSKPKHRAVAFVEVSIPCVNCEEVIRPTDEFCQGCGTQVTSVQKARLLERLEVYDARMAAHMKQVRRASRAIIALAALFTFSGVAMYFITKAKGDSTLLTLRPFPEDMVYPDLINGKSLTIAEVRAMIERESLEVLAHNLLLGAMMAGLWLWSKRAPLPATIAALALFATVHVGNALADPASVFNGMFLKIIGIVILAQGVRAALEARRIAQRQRLEAAEQEPIEQGQPS